MDDRYLWSIAILAVRADGTSEIAADYILASSLEDEARAEGLEQAKEMFPESKGFCSYFIAANPIMKTRLLKQLFDLDKDSDGVLDADTLNV